MFFYRRYRLVVTATNHLTKIIKLHIATNWGIVMKNSIGQNEMLYQNDIYQILPISHGFQVKQRNVKILKGEKRWIQMRVLRPFADSSNNNKFSPFLSFG